MSYDQFEAKIMKRNTLQMWMIGGAILIFGLAFFALASQRAVFVYRGGELFKERMLAERVCKESFLSITNGKPNPHLVSSGIRRILKTQNFDVKVNEILKVDSIEKGACRIILESAEGLLAFKVTLLEGRRFPFHYKLNQIDELLAQEEWL